MTTYVNLLQGVNFQQRRQGGYDQMFETAEPYEFASISCNAITMVWHNLLPESNSKRFFTPRTMDH